MCRAEVERLFNGIEFEVLANKKARASFMKSFRECEGLGYAIKFAFDSYPRNSRDIEKLAVSLYQGNRCIASRIVYPY